MPKRRAEIFGGKGLANYLTEILNLKIMESKNIDEIFMLLIAIGKEPLALEILKKYSRKTVIECTSYLSKIKIIYKIEIDDIKAGLKNTISKNEEIQDLYRNIIDGCVKANDINFGIAAISEIRKVSIEQADKIMRERTDLSIEEYEKKKREVNLNESFLSTSIEKLKEINNIDSIEKVDEKKKDFQITVIWTLISITIYYLIDKDAQLLNIFQKMQYKQILEFNYWLGVAIPFAIIGSVIMYFRSQK